MSMSSAPLGTIGLPGSMTFKIKGDKLRTETPLAGFASITNGSAHKAWVLDTAARTYTETDLEGMKATGTKPKSTAKATNTGRHDKVAGYACDVWTIDDPPSGRVELCMASGVSMIAFGLSGPFSAFAKGDDAWSEVMSHGFPLRIVMFDPSGGPMMKFEATRVEKKTEPDSLFEVPAGFTKK